MGADCTRGEQCASHVCDPDTLRCIELDQFEDLPAGVYLRGFLKQFAGMLGLPADRVVQEYMDAVDAWHAALSRRR